MSQIFPSGLYNIRENFRKLSPIFYKRPIHIGAVRIRYFLQIRRIEEIGKQHGITINIQGGKIFMNGLQTDFLRAKTDVQELLLRATRDVNEQREAEWMKDRIQWCYMDPVSQTVEQYDEETNLKLERAYMDKQTSVELFTENDETFIVDFTNMKEYSRNEEDDEAVVLRKNRVKGICRSPCF